jgi:hypothetical protein
MIPYKGLLTWLEKHDRKRIILDRQSQNPYLERYYIFLKDRKSFPFNMFLHKFLRSDPDDLHDHPWPYFTIILHGGYWEWVPVYNFMGHISGERKVWRGPGHFRFNRAKSYHRIEIEPGVECWTLFMPGPQQREWGFLTHGGSWKNFKWVNHDDYINSKSEVMEKL